MKKFLVVDGIECHYEESQPILDELSFTIEHKEIAGLLGPSGCGKTTLLRAIAGFIPIHSGKIVLDGCLLSSPESLVAPENRNIGMIFQDYALFPHLTVIDNISFGLHQQYSRKKKQQIVEQMLELVKIPDLGMRYPHELSSGQQQRVALARGLAPRPKLLLMDEPFSSLDAPMKRQLYIEVREILKEAGMTALVVTHDKGEAFAISDKLGILTDKCLLQWDTPKNLFCRPCDRQVASFIGRGQPISGRVVKHNQLATDIGLISTNNSPASWFEGDNLEIFLGPDEIILQPNAQCTQLVQGTVIKKAFMGASTLYTLELPSGQRVDSSSVNGHDFELGEKSGIQVKLRNLVAFKIADTPHETGVTQSPSDSPKEQVHIDEW